MRALPWARWARVIGLAGAGLFLAYLLVANVILLTPLLRGWINEDENALRVQYRSAWSLYPGHVAVRGLSIRYQDSNVQILLGMDRAKIRLNLWALTKRTLRVARLDAEGTTFRMRHKVETLEGNEGRVSAFPPIAGFADPPVEKKVPKPPIAEEDYRLWTLELVDIDATVREVWTMEYRYRGDASVAGGFHLRPKRELWITPSVMITHGGVLALGDRDLIRGGEGRVEVSFEPFDVRVPKGIQVLRHLNGSVHQTGELASLSSVAATYFPGSSVDLDRGAGAIEIDTRIEHGVFQPGSRVTYRTSDAVATVNPLVLGGDLAVFAHVEGPPDHPVVAVESALERTSVSPIAPSSSAARPLDVRDTKLSFMLDTADLVAEASVARASGAVTSARIADLRAWQPVAPKKSSFDGGAATFAARASYARGLLEGRLDVVLEQMRMTFNTFTFTASGKVESGIASADLTKAIAFPGARADLTDISLRLERGAADGIWLRARARDSVVATQGPASADTFIAVESGPGDRTMELFTRLARLPDVAADVTSGTQLDAMLHLRVRPRDVSLAVTEAKNGALEGRGRVRKTPAGLTGAFVMSLGPLHAGLELRDGEVSVRPLAGGRWLDDMLRKR